MTANLIEYKFSDIFERITQKNKGTSTNVLTISAQNGLVSQNEFFTKSVASKNLDNYTLLKKGDFAYNKSYSSGYPMGATKSLERYEEGVVSPLYFVFRIKTEVAHLGFMGQYFESGVFNKEVAIIAQEGARNHGMLNVSVKDFFNLTKLTIPPLEEQRKIAACLSTWDKAIDAYNRLIALKEQQKRGLMQNLFNPNSHLMVNDSKRTTVRLRDLLMEGKSRNKDNSIERVLSVTNSRGFVLPEEHFSKRVASKDVRNYKIVLKGEFGYNPSRLNVGSFARLERFENGLLSPMYVVFRVNENKLNGEYFLQWMNSSEAKRQILSSTQGSVRNSVSFDAIGAMKISIPSISKQNNIASILLNWDKSIDALTKKRDLLKQQKQGLMQQLFG